MHIVSPLHTREKGIVDVWQHSPLCFFYLLPNSFVVVTAISSSFSEADSVRLPVISASDSICLEVLLDAG